MKVFGWWISPSQMHQSGSGCGETLCVHSCWCQSANQLWWKTQFIVVSFKATWSPVSRESRRGGSLSEMQNTVPPKDLRTFSRWRRRNQNNTVMAEKMVWTRQHSCQKLMLLVWENATRWQNRQGAFWMHSESSISLPQKSSQKLE